MEKGEIQFIQCQSSACSQHPPARDHSGAYDAEVALITISFPGQRCGNPLVALSMVGFGGVGTVPPCCSPAPRGLGTDGQCSPRHQPHFEPSLHELNDIL